MRAVRAIVILALAAVGCGSHTETKRVEIEKPADVIVGAWTGRLQFHKDDLDEMSQPERSAALKYATTLRMEMTISEDGTYKMAGGEIGSTGTWKKEGDVLSMTDSSAKPENPYRTQQFAIEDGGKRLVGKDPTGKDRTLMVFEKA
jgi:hypothetical protein